MATTAARNPRGAQALADDLEGSRAVLPSALRLYRLIYLEVPSCFVTRDLRLEEALRLVTADRLAGSWIETIGGGVR